MDLSQELSVSRHHSVQICLARPQLWLHDTINRESQWGAGSVHVSKEGVTTILSYITLLTIYRMPLWLRTIECNIPHWFEVQPWHPKVGDLLGQAHQGYPEGAVHILASAHSKHVIYMFSTCMIF